MHGQKSIKLCINFDKIKDDLCAVVETVLSIR